MAEMIIWVVLLSWLLLVVVGVMDASIGGRTVVVVLLLLVMLVVVLVLQGMEFWLSQTLPWPLFFCDVAAADSSYDSLLFFVMSQPETLPKLGMKSLFSQAPLPLALPFL
jgi:hypothetical protein